jgi:hypothetical protein
LGIVKKELVMELKVKLYTDPGHGWVAVKRKLLDELGIADKITYFSYQKGKTVYLEEDCDLSTFATAMNLKGIILKYDQKHTNNRHPIRSYENYRY